MRIAGDLICQGAQAKIQARLDCVAATGAFVLMQLAKPLLRLPIRFSAEALAREVNALPRAAWTAHPQKFTGNSAVRLITAGGEPTDVIEGEMAPTPFLLDCPYIMQLMGEIGSVWGRSRLMALAPRSEVPAHIDSHYYWRTHIRIHIPVITNPDVSFTCGPDTVHMAPGECWVFDSFQRHEVHNRGAETRVHLVLDTVGGGKLRELIRRAEAGDDKPTPFEPGQGTAELGYERVNVPDIMSPWEIRCHVDFILANTKPHPGLDPVKERITRFIEDWTALWAQFGPDEKAAPRYAALLADARRDLAGLGAMHIPLENGLPLQHIFERLIVEAAIFSARHPAKAAASPSSTSSPSSLRSAL